MKDKQVRWWQRALKFALGGIRSAFGLFARPLSSKDLPDAQHICEDDGKIDVEIYKTEDPEEEADLTENSPNPEEIVATVFDAEHPSMAEESAEGVDTLKGHHFEGYGEMPEEGLEGSGHDFSRSIEDEVQTGASAPEGLPESPAITAASSTLEEVILATPEPEPTPQIETPASSESGPEIAPGTTCAKEAVDEATPLAEAANTGSAVPEVAAAPAFPEPQMDLNQPNHDETAEENQPPEDAGEMAQEAPAVELEAEKPAIESDVEAAHDQAETATAQPGQPAPPQSPATQPQAKHFIKLEGRENEADSSPFSVIVSQVYDGPLDLLLDLIRKQDIDIYDIPIARITAQFLAYVNQLKASDVDVAGEFIYTASLLIHIKSKMLLPRAPAGPEDEAEDPRRELVERLLEHERFKNAAQMLQQKQMLEAATWTNPGIREFREDVEAEPEIAADTVDLVRVFREILERARNRPVLNLQEDSVTVAQMIQFLARRLNMEDKPVALRRLLSHTKSERALIAMFLALLELVRLQAILLRQDRAFSEIFIKKNTEFDSVMNEGLANARDDWR